MKQQLSPLIIAALLISASAFCGPLSGTYTIGGTSPNYTTFTAAVTALTSNGISGPVIFNVRPGTYNERITIGAITGASRTNRITFQSATGLTSDVTLTYASTSASDIAVVYLNGAGYVTLKNMTVVNTGVLNIVYASYPHPSSALYYSGYYLWAFGDAVVIDDGAHNDSLVNNILAVPATNFVVGSPGDYYYSTNALGEAEQIFTYDVIDATGTNNLPSDSIVIAGNQINNGNFGFYGIGGYGVRQSNGLVIANNTFSNQFAESIILGNDNYAQVVGNTILDTAFDAGYQAFGIYMSGHNDQVRILNNKIFGSRQALYMANSPGVVGKEGLIANNFMSGFTVSTSVSYGAISVVQSSNQLFYNNSVLSTYGGYSANATFSAQTDTNIALLNNIFYNNKGGSAISINTPRCLSVSDYNDFYTLTDTIGAWNNWTHYVTSLAAWQDSSGLDAHSRFLQPPFVSTTDFHLTDYGLMRFGNPLVSVPDDIDGHVRSLITTDVGASESPSSAGFTPSSTAVCAGSSITFNDESTGSPSNWNWTFPGGTPHNSTQQNPTITYDTAGTYAVKLVVNGSLGTDSITIASFVTVYPVSVGGTVSASHATICPNSAAVLTLTGSIGNVQWQSSPDSINYSPIVLSYYPYVTASGDTLTVHPLATTWYRAVVTSAICSQDTSTVQEVVVNPVGCGSPISLSLSSSSASCGQNIGVVTGSVTLGDGSGLYTYAIYGPVFQTGSTNYGLVVFDSLYSGDYRVTIWDTDYPDDSVSTTVSVVEAICGIVTTTNASSDCRVNGTLSVSASGGDGDNNYVFTISGPTVVPSQTGASANFTNLAEGCYTVVITDADNPADGFEDSLPNTISGNCIGSNGPCNNNPATPSLTGSENFHPCYYGTETYYTDPGMTDYNWQVVGTTYYTIVAGGGTADDSITITWTDPGGGVVLVSYVDQNSVQSNTTDLASYPFNCTPISFNTSTGVTSGCSASDGTITVTGVTGGDYNGYNFSHYEVFINDVDYGPYTGAAIPGFAPGIYEVLVADQDDEGDVLGYSDSVSVSIICPITATVMGNSVSTCGGSDGSITVSNIAGGDGNGYYSIFVDGSLVGSNFTGGQSYTVLTGASPGNNYSVVITDANDPSDYNNDEYSNYSITISDYCIPISITVASQTDDYCNQNTGTLTVTASGGDGNSANYTWSIVPGSQTGTGPGITFTGLTGGYNYTIYVQDGSNDNTFIYDVVPGGTFGDNGTYPLPTIGGSSLLSICTGQAYSYNSAYNYPGTYSYQWSISDPAATISPTNASTTSVTWETQGISSLSLTVTDDNGCTAVVTDDAIVGSASPTLSPIAPVCAGSSGDVYSTENYENYYVWNVTGGIITSGGSATDNTVTVTWDAAGTGDVSVNYTDPNSGCSATTDSVITIYPLPTPAITSVSGSCAGSAGNVYTTESGESNYIWTIIGGNITAGGTGTDDSVTISWSSAGAGEILLNYTDPTTGCTATQATDSAVTIHPALVPPKLTPDDSIICSSDSTIIHTSGSYRSYAWNDGDTTNYTYANQAGGYWVTVTDVNGCTAVSDHKNISVYPASSVSIEVHGDTLSSFNSSHYQWFINDTLIPGATSSVYVAHRSGTYAVQVIDSNSCSTLSSGTQITISGIDNLLEDGSLSIYPDPFVNTIFIKVNGSSIDIQNVELYNVLGEAVINKKIALLPATLIPVDVSVLPEGVYFIKLKTNYGDHLQKMIKE